MKLKLYYYISKCYEYNGQYESADIAFDKFRKEANRKGELEIIYFRLGTAYWYYEDYINGMTFKLKALNIGEFKGIIESIYTIGNKYRSILYEFIST